MDDELEPAPDPTRIRNPRSRRPDAPARVPAALRSLNEKRAFSIRRPTESEALEVKSEITSAVYYLNRWETNPATGEKYDVRVRPYITEHYEVGGQEILARDATGADKARATDHYFKTNFWVHPPLPRGFRQMPKEEMEKAHRSSAETRGLEHFMGEPVAEEPSSPKRPKRRTVERRAE